MPVLRLVALDIADPAGYARYRAAMAPHLARHGGRFVLDVEGTAHIHPAGFAPGRVLLIEFPTEEDAAGFMGDPAYRAVRARHFDPAVAQTEAFRVPSSPHPPASGWGG
ncbi:MAG: DUF1330 domain-containing protein [Alphaproteobacteria bacterium]|nr:DUF1330 domain-containing protein [Alphaproteobacteria bacterium]